MKLKNETGFTYVELLMALMIIGIGAAIAAPHFGNLLRIDTMCHEGLASQKVMRVSHLTFRKQNMPQTV